MITRCARAKTYRSNRIHLRALTTQGSFLCVCVFEYKFIKRLKLKTQCVKLFPLLNNNNSVVRRAKRKKKNDNDFFSIQKQKRRVFFFQLSILCLFLSSSSSLSSSSCCIIVVNLNFKWLTTHIHTCNSGVCRLPSGVGRGVVLEWRACTVAIGYCCCGCCCVQGSSPGCDSFFFRDKLIDECLYFFFVKLQFCDVFGHLAFVFSCSFFSVDVDNL